MSVKSVVYAALQAIAPAFPSVAPVGTKGGRFTYQGVAGGDTANFDGDGSGATWARVQIDAWADDKKTAEFLAAQARAALYAALTVGEITDNPDDYEVDTKLHRVSFDVNAWA